MHCTYTRVQSITHSQLPNTYAWIPTYTHSCNAHRYAQAPTWCTGANTHNYTCVRVSLHPCMSVHTRSMPGALTVQHSGNTWAAPGTDSLPSIPALPSTGFAHTLSALHTAALSGGVPVQPGAVPAWKGWGISHCVLGSQASKPVF